jgi:hypothetical protein
VGKLAKNRRKLFFGLILALCVFGVLWWGYLRYERLKKYALTAVMAPRLLDSLLGMKEPSTYLILSQNNAELRPTGGLVSSYAEVTVRRGRVVEFKYRELPQAPESESEIEIPSWWARLERPVWVYWDTNWTADFPTAAQQAKWFYEAGGNVDRPLDGVMAIDQVAVQMLLEVSGPVYVPSYDLEVDSENLLSLIEQYRAYHRPMLHKELLGDTAKALLEKLSQADPRQVLAVAQAVGQALGQKHILVFFGDPGLEALIARWGWDGAINSTKDDFLFAVDANMGGTKVDTQVEKTIHYEVIIGSDYSITSKATLDYYNGSSAAEVGLERGWRGGTYWDYVRLYVPEGSLLAETRGNDYPTQIAAEGSKTSLGNLFVVPIGERAQLSYTYINSAKINRVSGRNVYHLTVQKQPGTLGNTLAITVTLPAGSRLMACHPEPNSVRDNVVEYELALHTDQTFKLVFH